MASRSSCRWALSPAGTCKCDDCRRMFVRKLPSYGRMSMVSFVAMPTTGRYSNSSSPLGTVEESNSSGTCRSTGASNLQAGNLVFLRVWWLLAAGVGSEENVRIEARQDCMFPFPIYFPFYTSIYITVFTFPISILIRFLYSYTLSILLFISLDFVMSPFIFHSYPVFFPYLVSHSFPFVFPPLASLSMFLLISVLLSFLISLVVCPCFFLLLSGTHPEPKELEIGERLCQPSPSTARITEGRNELHMLMSAPSIKAMAFWQASCSNFSC